MSQQGLLRMESPADDRCHSGLTSSDFAECHFRHTLANCCELLHIFLCECWTAHVFDFNVGLPLPAFAVPGAAELCPG